LGFPKKVVSVVGLGKLGAPLAALLAVKGYRVMGIDRNPDVVRAINQGRAPVDETELQDYMDRAGDLLTAALDFGKATTDSRVTMVVVPTPSDGEGIFSNTFVCDVMEELGRSLRGKHAYHVVNVMSTVMPGSCDGELRQTLERASGRQVGENLGLCYNPEFIALGSVLRDMRLPDFVLLGESDSRAGEEIQQIYRRVCENDPPIRRMGLINAEISKIAVNTFVTTKISYANMLAEICERLPGADADTVTKAVGSDSRIGTKYLRGALGYGGPCFPRDNMAFIKLAEALGVHASIPRATDATNRNQVERLLKIVTNRIRQGGSVGILGMSYKPDTPIIEGSQSLMLASALLEKGHRVTIYDPAAAMAASAELGKGVTVASSVDECAGAVDFLVIATQWPQFENISPAVLRRPGGKLPVLDCWRQLCPATYEPVIELIQLGRGATRSSEPAALKAG